MDNLIQVLKKYDKVIIQTHDNPDADAIASGFGMLHLVERLGISAELIYYGKLISKPNLAEMVKQLNVPIINKDASFKVGEKELLLVIDSQRGSRNVYSYEAHDIACIDHHLVEGQYPYVYSNIQSKVGSCSTVVHNYLHQTITDVDPNVLTALYFGLLMDTNNFITKYTNMDRDCREALEGNYNEKTITKLVRTSLTFDDIKICADAMGQIERYDDVVYSYVGDCDDNLLGHISDMLSEIAGVNMVIIYSERRDSYKLSLRSYHDYITAEDIVKYLCEGIGSGGGHINKAGGWVSKEQFKSKSPNSTFDTYIKLKTIEFTKTLKFFEEGKDDPIRVYGISNFNRVKKKKYKVRYISLSEHFKDNEIVSIKTLEGTVNVKVKDGSIVIIGAKGEAYPITSNLFGKRYKTNGEATGSALCDDKIDDYGIVLTSEDNVVKFNNMDVLTLPIAETTDETEVLAKRLTGGVKVRTQWGDIYMENSGYLVYVDINNYYLCDEEIFHLTYEVEIPESA